MLITPLHPADYDQWLPLWLANMEHSVNADVTALTWQRLCDPAHTVKGLCARDTETGPIIGICHYVLHPTTGNLKPVCYMQDLFVSPDARRKGAGRKLVTYLAALGTTQKWARLYWLAESKNEAAQQLYQSLGLKLDFTLHILPL